MRNRYGTEIECAKTRDSGPIPGMVVLLRSLGVRCETEWAFDVTGERAHRFDLAAFADGSDVPAFLLEWDGPAHYDPAFYHDQGNRPCRNYVHVLASQMSDINKELIANRHRVPLFRLTPAYGRCWQDFLRMLVWRLVDGGSTGCIEADVVESMRRGGWDFTYVRPRNVPKALASVLDGVETRCDDPGADALCEGCEHRQRCLDSR